ncbi:SsrA-binding protein SmpB [Demequina sp. SYSU T00039]|uniref:SsrA-binding protein n=1 Tax=Demequina lignilytica TaxID=3051663 RepID=A0AAW7M2F6_9MICO|nr:MULTISPECIES: SsrA-binding protein SmpB [unclassified Demequina]MDN4478904.1 SsrA-binding protein SmpB [Demequina sp. SYSU T00039-1]MDN4488779.1 SsrA-binding protein SmpB [Demequina sp. SYSU T00039]MDN4491837.1 SsrA-binding protein SmpB [Demequina sp. SYSU T00068]
MVEAEKVIATNRAARHDYFVDDVFEAGIVLTGTEVKSLRQGRATIGDGYVYVDGGEAWADNLHIPEYAQGTWTNHAPRRKRKLLLHTHEIEELQQATREKGFTIIPLRMYFLNGRAKLEIGIARGKKMHDKRQALREKQDKREAERAFGTQRRINT